MGAAMIDRSAPVKASGWTEADMQALGDLRVVLGRLGLSAIRIEARNGMLLARKDGVAEPCWIGSVGVAMSATFPGKEGS